MAACANQPCSSVPERPIDALAGAAAGAETCPDHVKGPLVTMGSPDSGFKRSRSQLRATKHTVSGCHTSL